MRWRRDVQCNDWMVKAAATPAESEQLAAEVGALRLVAHPGVVELGPVTTGSDGLLTARTRYVGPSLELAGPLAPPTVAGLGAALATVLADLHDLDRTHGQLEPGHVLLDAGGRPVLCGFSSQPASAEADVEALRRVLSGCLDGPAPGRLAKLLNPSSRRAKAITARALADGLAGCLPDVCLPTLPSGDTPVVARPSPSPADLVKRHPLRVADPNTGDDESRRPVTLAVAAIVLVFVVGAALTLVFTHHRARPPAQASCPTVDDGCSPVAVHAGVFTTASGRWAIDLRPVVVVVGRWRCSGEGLPAALDPATGQIWAWRAWPGQTVISAQTVAHVPGAVDLGVEPEASGCDRLVVLRSRAAPLVLEVASGA